MLSEGPPEYMSIVKIICKDAQSSHDLIKALRHCGRYGNWVKEDEINKTNAVSDLDILCQPRDTSDPNQSVNSIYLIILSSLFITIIFLNILMLIKQFINRLHRHTQIYIHSDDYDHGSPKNSISSDFTFIELRHKTCTSSLHSNQSSHIYCQIYEIEKEYVETAFITSNNNDKSEQSIYVDMH